MRRKRYGAACFPDHLNIVDSQQQSGITLWLLRILVPLGGHLMWLDDNGFRSDQLARRVGMAHWLDDKSLEFNPKIVIAELRELHRLAEELSTPVTIPEPLPSNAARLSALLGLSTVEIEILQFLIMMQHEPLLEEATDFIGMIAGLRGYQIISTVLGLPELEVRTALTGSSRLAMSGLVRPNHGGLMCLSAKFDLIGGGFAERMLMPLGDPVQIFKHQFVLAPAPCLSLNDYEHVRSMLDILIPHLRCAQAEGRLGVNAFIYGPPGTGKSQLPRVIAKLLDVSLFEVSSEDQDGDPIGGEKRLRAFSAAQSVLKRKSAILAFDESEDVFGYADSLVDKRGDAQLRKGWVNRALEENKVPCIWISNAVSCVDPAFLRRFNVVMEIGIPPRRQRAAIVSETCGDWLDARSVMRIAESPNIAPAIISRAATVIRDIEPNLSQEQTSASLIRLIDGTLVAQGHQSLRQNQSHILPDYYDPSLLNVDTDLIQLAEGISRSGSARLCLYGPPGTGKSAFGRWLATRLDRPLHAKRTSDLMSQFLGGTERNLAQAFQAAAADKAILMLDEVDSYLQDRQKAVRNWEVTEVNEMLTQMEGFEGIFVASTNLIDDLDPAALRRFDMKLHFDYLLANQAWTMFERQALALGLAPPPAALKDALRGIGSLTPGDFASVARRARFNPIKDNEALLAALASECRMRQNFNRKTIGFFTPSQTSN